MIETLIEKADHIQSGLAVITLQLGLIFLMLVIRVLQESRHR